MLAADAGFVTERRASGRERPGEGLQGRPTEPFAGFAGDAGATREHRGLSMSDPDDEPWKAPEEHRRLDHRVRFPPWVLILAAALLAGLVVAMFMEHGGG